MHDWKLSILAPQDTMEEAVNVLTREALRIALVCDSNGVLLGTITDGDIRRALIQHCAMDTPVTDVMFKEPTVASVADSRESILSSMKNLDLLQIPVVDSSRRVVGLETLQDLVENQRYDNPVFLMAGGFGKRLRPLTQDLPKPMLKVGEKPILETIIEQFVEAGFHNFYISTHFRAEKIGDYFGDGARWGVRIRYVHEEKPLGTAGALGLLPKGLPKLPIIVMNGDLLTKVNFKNLLDFHNDQGGIATMCVCKYDFQIPYGVVEAEGQCVTGIVEKPMHKFFVNAGLYVLNSSLLEQVDGSSYLDMPQFLEAQVKSDAQVNMFPIHEYWLDIGQMDQFERAQIDSSEFFQQ